LETKPVTIKDTILTLRSYAIELLRKWYLYVIIGSIFLAYNYYKAHQQPTTYQANASLMINNDGGAVSGLLQLAGQFGLGGSSELKTEKLVELITSKRMIYSALMQKVSIDGQSDLLINHYIKIFEPEFDARHEPIDNFQFTEKSVQDFKIKESAIAQTIYDDISQFLLSANVGGKSGIIRVSCNSESEGFSKEFLETLCNTLRNYYADKTVEQQNRAYQVISHRCDSLEHILYGTEYALANWIDANRTALRAGSLPAKQGIKREQYKREAEILNVMYIEAIKNRELAHINLLLSTPSVQIIDYPSYPIKPNVPNRLNMYIMALLAAAIVVTVGVVFNKMVRDAFQNAQ
jgi:uncharacterized protein involved in exopolysaccharide biosynthesis